MNRPLPLATLALLCLLAGTPVHPAPAAEVKVLLPLGRAVYQTNEWIDVTVLRSAADGLKNGPLVLALAGPEGSQVDLTFTARAAEGRPAVAAEHLRLDGRLLRPGKYAVRAAVDGASGSADFEVCSHVRQSPFKTIDWSSHAAKHEQRLLGADSLGFNFIFYAYGGIDVEEMIRGGEDYMRCCAMGGWHYMDLRRECDWSDPYVLGGGLARATKQVFQDRTNPNCLGIHLYDEPLLAEVKDPTDPDGKRLVRHGVTAQERSFRAAFGHDAPKLAQTDFTKPEDARRWAEYNRWRLLLLEAAWKIAGDSVSRARPDYATTSQTQWAWQAFDAGYYWNVNRPFPIVSRHALYDYKAGGDFAPSFAFEFGRIRDLGKPNWYLPMWGSGHGDLYRAEQYLSFMQNLHGLAKPPDLLAHRPSKTPVTGAVVEVNKTAARLGPIFETLPVTRPEVAVLYSMAHNLHERTRDSMDSYRGNSHFQKLLYLYIASKILHTPLDPVVEEDILDGTLARHHKVVLLAGVDHLDPKVTTALEAFAAAGGHVLVSAESKVRLQGATTFDLPADGLRLVADMEQWAQDKRWDRWSETVYSHGYYTAAQGVAEALRPQFEKLGVKPVFDCDGGGIVASRQALGDVEYLFAVNATPDRDTFGWYFLAPAVATIGVADNGRPVYDALHGGPVEGLRPKAGRLSGTFRFGPGQMRVLARTARPVGGLQLLPPLQFSDYTAPQNPLRVEISAVLVDDRKQVLCGSAPLQVEVIDPLGAKRYDLYRATDRGVLRLALPLAANDPAGDWTVRVCELLNNTEATTSFRYQPPGQCGAVAGGVPRALSFGRDRDNLFRFFRTHKDLTIVKGTSKFHEAAAERLAKALAPWDIRCKVIAADEVKRRVPTPEEKPTWVDAGGAFDLRGPAVLLGSPDDNHLIRHLRDQKFLPYAPVKDQLPGRGRGLLAWQLEGLSYFGHESVTLIAFDEAGLAEAVGTAYEIAAGIEPLTPLVLPQPAAVRPAARADAVLPEMKEAWRQRLPDRCVSMKAVPAGVVVLGADGTLTLLTPGGAVAWRKTFGGSELWSLDAARDGRLIALGTGRRLYVLDAGGKALWDRAVDRPADADHCGEGISWVAVAPDGSAVLAAATGYSRVNNNWQSAGTLTLFDAAGKKLWGGGGLDDKTGKPVLAERSAGGFFGADGKQIIVLGDNTVTSAGQNKVVRRAYFLDAATGRQVQVHEARLAAPLGDNVLLSDGEGKLVLAAPADGKVRAQLDCGQAAPVVWAAGDGGTVLGTETDGSVRLLRGLDGKLDGQTVWRDQAETRIVKALSVRGKQVAVGYWGGTVCVLDDGKRRCRRAFPQDVAVLTWSGDHLLVGLADGEVVALQLRP
jgi:hypothetical protein